MPLPEPVIDDRSYNEILSEALARIPVHTPEWTNFAESDPGVTLVQLFAFMTESLLYRANRVPERNRLRFLNLLGEGLQPATPAAGLVTFGAAREVEAHALAGGTEVFAGGVPFRTRDGLDVLPVEGRVYYKAALGPAAKAEVQALYDQLYASFLEAGTEAEPYETRLLEPPTPGAALPVMDLASGPVDGALWLALLAPRTADPEATRRAIAGKTLTLAIVPAVTEAARVLPPGNRTAGDERQADLRFERPDLRDITGADPEAVPPARYAALPARAFDNVLAGPGVVELQLPGVGALGTWSGQEPLEAGVGDYPPSLEDAAVADRVITWVRIRVGDTGGGSGSATARLSFVGVNGAVVEQRAEVSAEFVGLGTGEPDQAFALVATPVLPESVALTVNGETWGRIDDLTAAGAEVQPKGAAFVTPPAGGERVRVYALDPASGAVRFGDGLHGARPPKGAVIQASYASGGGTRGLVGIGAISKGAALPSSVKVTNPVPTWGASDAETVAAAERRIPATLAHRHRLVTEADFEEITRRTPGVDVGRVEVLPVTRPTGTAGAVVGEAAGAVTVLVIPAADAEQPDAPRPDRLFLNAVCATLDPRRLITTEVHVRGPVYVPVYVSVGIGAVPGQDLATVREGVKAALTVFLSPLAGGYGARGWPLGNAVETATLLAVAARVDGVARVNGLLLGTEAGASGTSVAVQGLQLPRLAGLAVQAGDPLPLDGLLGVAEDGPARVPVPVVPATC